MAEEIITSPEESISMETPIVESPVDIQEDVVDVEPPSKGLQNLQTLHSLLKENDVYSKITPERFDDFVNKYKDPAKLKTLHSLLIENDVYSKIMPADINVAADKYGFGGLGKPSAVPSPSVSGGSATKGRGVEQPSTLPNGMSFTEYPEGVIYLTYNVFKGKKEEMVNYGGISQIPLDEPIPINIIERIAQNMKLPISDIKEKAKKLEGKTAREVIKLLSTPSSSQPFGLSPELQSAVSGISEEMSKQGVKYATEDAAFKDYERLQTYFSKVDKVKRGGVGSGMNRSGIPESQEDQNIRADAFSGKYDLIKRQAELAQAKMSESLKPIIEKDITEKYLKKNDDGFLVPDEAKIDEYAKSIAKRYGLSDSGFLKEVVYNEATSMAAFREREPDIIKRFEKLIQPNLVAPGLIEKSNQEVWKNFTTDEVEQVELDKKVGTLAADLKVKSKADENAVQYELQKQVSNLNMSYAQMQAQTSAQFEELDNQYKNGMPRDQYEAAFNNLKQGSEQAYAAYTDDRLKLFDQGQKSLNQISNKYNAQLRRQSEELNNIAREKVNKAAEQYQKKYGKNPKLEAEIKKLYEKAYKESVDDKNNQIDKYNKDRTTGLILKYKQFGGILSMTDRFLRSVDSAAGGSLKGIGTSLGIDSLQLYGDFLQGSVSLPKAKTKEWSDLFDPMNLSQLTGQLVGSMTPAIIAATAVAGLTRNAPLAYKMAAIGVARFWVESSDIAGRMRDETFARTQSVAKANIASEKSWESQYKIIPFYSLSGLPFINTAGTWMKTLPRVARVALGAGAQLVEEVPQETLQGIAEENIRAELDPFDDYYKKISEDDWKRIKETTITVAPVMILGGGAELSGPRELTKKQQMKQQVDSYAAQAKVNELVGNMQGQWVSQMVSKKGDAFAIATINALFTDGTIDEQTRDQLQENVTTSKKNFEDAKTLGLSQSEGVVYDALTQAYLEKKAQYEQAEQNGDEILADNLNADMTNIRNQAKEFAQNKQGDFFVFQFEDGSQKIVTNSNWSSDAEILDLIASDQISVSAYSENGKALLDSITPKVEEQKVAQKRTTEEKLKAQREMEAEDLTPQSEQAQQTEEAPQAEATTEGNVGMDSFTGEAKDIINESINDINEDIEYYKEKVRKGKPTTKAGKVFRAILFKSNAEQTLEKFGNDLKLLKENPIEFYKNRVKYYSKGEGDRSMIEYFQDKIDILESNKVTPQAQTAPLFEAPTIEAPTQEQEAAPQALPEVENATPTTEAQAPVAEEAKGEVTAIEPKIILSGLNDGFQAVSYESFDPRSDRGVMDEIQNGRSFVKIVEQRNGKRYIVVGVTLSPESRREARTNGRDNYSFAVAELNESTPSDIVKTLENSAKENFKNIYRDFSDKDFVIPINESAKSEVTNQLTPTTAATPTSEQAPQAFPAQEGAESEQKKDGVSAELEQIYRDLYAAVNKNLDPKTLEAVKRNPTLVMVEKALRELEKKGVIRIKC